MNKYKRLVRPVQKMNDTEYKLSKYLFGIGIVSVIVLPQYAYYWKRTTMETLGVRNDLERIKLKGKNITDIPKKE